MAVDSNLISELAQRELARLTRKVFFRFGVWVAVTAALVVGWVLLKRPVLQSRTVITLTAVIGLVWLLSWAMSRRGHVRPAMVVAITGVIMGVGLMVFHLQTGLQAPALALLPLVVAMAGVLGTAGYAGYAAALSVVIIAGLYALEQHGLLNRIQTSAELAPLVFAAAHLLVLAVALGSAILISQALVGALRRAVEQESRFKALLDIGADWYWEQDADLRYTFFSESYARVTGLDPRALLGLRRTELPGLTAVPVLLQAHLAALAARQPFRDFVTDQVMSDGTQRHFSVSGEPRFDREGGFLGYWGVTREVTPEVRAKRLADASEAQYRNLFTGSPIPTLIYRDFRIVMVNDAAQRLLGAPSTAALVGSDLRALFDDQHHDTLDQRHAAVLGLPFGESLPTIEVQACLPGGGRALVQMSCARVQLPDGPACQTQLIDVTAIRQAKAAQERADVLLARIYAATTDAVVLCRMDTDRIVYVNPAFSQMMGFSSDEAVGRSASELNLWAHEDDRLAMRAQLAEQGEARMPVVNLRARDGRLMANEMSASVFALDGQPHALIVHRDITEAELSRALNEAVLSSASIGIAVTRDGWFKRVNPMFAAMVGWEAQALQGQSIAACLPASTDVPELRASYLAQMEQGETPELVLQLRRRDESLIWCRARAQLLDPRVPQGGMVVVVHDITAELEAQQVLANAKARAEAASLAKSAFLANTSHEIRTPLNAVLGLARLARDTDQADKRDQYIGRLIESAESLVAIISDTLDLAKIEAGKLSLEMVGFDLARLLQALHQAYVDAATDRGLRLTLDLPDDLPWVVGDSVRLRQILGNFLSNAIKFTERGEVRLRARLDAEGQLMVDITDTGIGIPPDAMDKLFSPFTQADASTTRRYGGTGLGLSICRELAHLMGGEVGVESRPGEGSRFWLQVPVQITAPEGQSEPAAGADLAPVLAGIRVLLVEDNELNRLIASTMLESWGIEVVEAFDGEQALAAMQRERGRFDLILMDVHMPVLNGYEATRQLRLTSEGAQVPIIALTAAALASERDQALAAGMNDFVSKPIDVDQLRTVISRWIRRATVPVGQAG